MTSCGNLLTMTDDEKRAKRNAYMREYYRKNREKIIERTSEYHRKRKAENPELVRELARKKSAEWREKNPEREAENRRRGRIAARKRAMDYVNAIKAETPCADCGQFFPPVCMDFDHVNGDKEHNIGNLVGQNRSLATIQREIDKCELVCANCHRLRTYSRIVQLKGATQHDDND